MSQPQFPRRSNNNIDQNPNPQFHHYTSDPKKSSHTCLASCAVATVFLLAVAAAAAAVYFFLFKPKPPLISVNAVQFPTFSLDNNTVNFELFQYVTVTNPNRDEFSHYDSSLQLLVYSGEPVGTVFIPAGRISGGSRQKMSAELDLKEYPLPAAAQPQKVALGGGGGAVGNVMEVQTKMRLVGRVRVLKVFMHRVESGVKCRVAVEVTRGTVLGVRC